MTIIYREQDGDLNYLSGQTVGVIGYGNLGRTLAQNNYFVSDTNYGWGSDSIGDRTDIPNWTEWFASASTPTYMSALFNESGQNSEYTRTIQRSVVTRIVTFDH